MVEWPSAKIFNTINCAWMSVGIPGYGSVLKLTGLIFSGGLISMDSLDTLIFAPDPLNISIGSFK